MHIYIQTILIEFRIVLVLIQLYLPLFILNKLFPNEVSHTEILKNSCYSGQEAT